MHALRDKLTDKLTEKLASHGISIPILGNRSDEPVDSNEGEGEGAQGDEETEVDMNDPTTLARTYTISIENTSGLPIQIVSWPVKQTSSDYLLACLRGSPSHFHSLPLSGTISIEPTFPLGTTLGPKHLDPRTRNSFIYFDLVRPEGRGKVHLQAYLKFNRAGVGSALLGRTDLDSNEKNPMPSGELGNVRIDGHNIVFVVGKEIEEVENVVSDETKKGIKEFPGKGIEVSSYVSHDLARTSFIIGNEARYHEYTPPTTPSLLSPIRTSLHKLESLSARYIGAFVQHLESGSLFDGHVKVNAVTGIAKGKGFDSTADTKVIFKEGVTINYGFHDAGEGRKDQVYVYLTKDHSTWITDLIKEYPVFLTLRFSILSLAAAHDSGMCYKPPPSLDPGLLLLIQQGHLGNALSNHAQESIAAPVVHVLVSMLEELKLSPERVISNIALTQKDSIDDQLLIGVRFFDFRPGFCFTDVINAKKGEIHHQHAMVPGVSYISFLVSILNFLGSNPQELVMVELKSSGFVITKNKYSKIHPEEIVVYSMIPSIEEFEECLVQARAACSTEEGRNVGIGGVEDLDSPIGDLIESNKRFIMIDKSHFPDAWPRADSYDHKAYNTDDPAPIIAFLEKTHQESSKLEPKVEGVPMRGAIYQLQATPTANLKDDVRASITYSDSSSLLTYMKPRMDRATYPWIESHTFQDPGNVIFLNDFVEGVLVEHCIEVSKQRAGVLI